MSEREFWIAIRAALIQQEKALGQQRSAILMQIAEIEKRFDIVTDRMGSSRSTVVTTPSRGV